MNERLKLHMTLEKILVCLLLALILTGCAAHKAQTVSREITKQTWLSFLKEGKPLRQKSCRDLEHRLLNLKDLEY